MTEKAILDWPAIQARLKSVFPEGTPHRNYLTWEIAARTVFVLLYIRAIKGTDVWLRPDQVTRMTDTQAALTDDASRAEWARSSMVASKGEVPGRWYAVNTRESIRDDTLRNALVEIGAVVERLGLATTSPAGRYALQEAFAALFDPSLDPDELEAQILAWQERYLSASERMRIAVNRGGAAVGSDRLLVQFPSGETRRMAPGPSSQLSKHVIEEFAPRFLQVPAVIFLSESKDKVVQRDDELAKSIGLNILADRNLPDIILADTGPEKPLLVFVEVVASDGPVSEARKRALLALTDAAGFASEQVTFVTAYFDRSAAQFKKTVDKLAWGSLAWFAAEPEHLVQFHNGALVPIKLS